LPDKLGGKMKIWSGQLEVDEKWRPLFSAFVVIFAIVLPLTFLPMMIHQAQLGPGLGDPTGEQTWQALYEQLSGLSNNGPLFLVFGLAAFGVIFRIRCIAAGYFLWHKEHGEPYPIKYIALFMLIGATAIVAIYTVLGLVGLASWLLGYDFALGWQAVENLSASTHHWVMTNIPTLVELPPWLAVVVIYMLQGFLHYWLHRFGHTFRAGWLLFHRPHHMSPALIYPATSEVFYSIPLFLIAVVPYNLIFAASSKLFAAEPIYMGILLINLFTVISEIYGHNTALYHEGRKNPIIKLLGWTFLNGPYHYLHHSSEHADAGKGQAVNMINIGGGLFGLWDKVFGTYSPLREKRPPVGLTGNPELYMNPLRLAFSGVAQMLYELWHNRGLKVKLKIIFGGSDWNPPITKDYAIR
jgi:sterol desaturase/sphingolipid hydroxylase (fatty acid hydroxylase superfamily)